MANWKETLKELTSKNLKTRAKAKNKADLKWHAVRAMTEAKKSGGIKNIKKTKHGTKITYKDGTGYWLGE